MYLDKSILFLVMPVATSDTSDMTIIDLVLGTPSMAMDITSHNIDFSTDVQNLHDLHIIVLVLQKYSVFCNGPSYSVFCNGPSYSVFCNGPSYSVFCNGPSYSVFCNGPSYSVFCNGPSYSVLCNGPSYSVFCNRS